MFIIYEHYCRARVLGDVAKSNLTGVMLALEPITVDSAIKKQILRVQNELTQLNELLDEKLLTERKSVNIMFDREFDEIDAQKIQERI